MRKYSYEQKLRAVEDYCSGQRGLRVIAAKHSVDISIFRLWISRYRQNGIEGLRTKRRGPNVTAEFKLVVLNRIDEEGLSFRETAAAFNMRKSDVIGDWQRAYARDGMAGLRPRRPSGRKGSAAKRPEGASPVRQVDLQRLVELPRLAVRLGPILVGIQLVGHRLIVRRGDVERPPHFQQLRLGDAGEHIVDRFFEIARHERHGAHFTEEILHFTMQLDAQGFHRAAQGVA